MQQSIKIGKTMKKFIEENHYTDPHEILFFGAYLVTQALDYFIKEIDEKLSDKDITVNTENGGLNFIEDAHHARKLMSNLGGRAQYTIDGGPPIFGPTCDYENFCDKSKEKNNYAIIKNKEQNHDKDK